MDKKESSFVGLVGVPTKGWKETAPWKKKSDSELKSISTWSLASILKVTSWTFMKCCLI